MAARTVPLLWERERAKAIFDIAPPKQKLPDKRV